MIKTEKQLSEYLMHAERMGEGVRPLTEIEPELTIEEAYQIQLETVQHKLAEGYGIVGKKIGLTSVAMQKLLNVSEPDYGHLFNNMVVNNNGNITFDRVIQPKVEGEVAFILKKDLTGPNLTAKEVLEATDYVLPALEIVDSRISDWKIKLVDTVADNASSALFVLGESPVKTENVNLAEVEMHFYKNGDLINTGVGADVLGHPANCVAWLGNKLSEYGVNLKAGEIILSGALSAAVNAEPGDIFDAKISGLGEVRVGFSHSEGSNL